MLQSAMTYWYTELFTLIALFTLFTFTFRIEPSEGQPVPAPGRRASESSCAAFRYVRLEVEDTAQCNDKMSLGEFMLFDSEETQLALNGTESFSDEAANNQAFW